MPRDAEDELLMLLEKGDDLPGCLVHARRGVQDQDFLVVGGEGDV